MVDPTLRSGRGTELFPDKPGDSLGLQERVALTRRIEYLESLLEVQSKHLADKHKMLTNIYASHGWTLLQKYYRLRNRFLPPFSRRRSFVKWLLQGTAKGVKRASSLLGFRWELSEVEAYKRWISQNEPRAVDLKKQRETRFAYAPKFSILVPTFNTPRQFLAEMLRSVLEQTYDNWELCVADGNSEKPEVRALLEPLARRDPRIKLRFLPTNEGIVGNSNAALALATGEYVTLLDHDDTLAPFALFELVRTLNDHPDADFLYSDEDKITTYSGQRRDPHFKPDYAPDTLRSYNYICHLSVFRRSLLDQIGGFRPGFDGSQDYDLILRATEQAQKIVHVPKVLYHWRIHQHSTSTEQSVKQYSMESARKALTEHLQRVDLPGTVKDDRLPGTYRIVAPLTERPLVSLIIPTKDQTALLANCLDSLERSTYRNFEVILVENHSKEPETFDYYRRVEQRPEFRVLTWNPTFNYAAINNWAALQARGDVLLFLNNDVEVITADWIESMLQYALRLDVGAVGAKLYFPDDTVQHGGVIVGLGGIAGHAHKNYDRDAQGYVYRLMVTQNLSAVTGACLMVRKTVFEELQGFDERFIMAFNDIDFCLRLRQKGYKVIWTPHVELYHHESKTRGPDDTPEKAVRFQVESTCFLARWGLFVEAGDPYYNPNLTTGYDDMSLRLE
jgi:GT2 family glycosyltransferase